MVDEVNALLGRIARERYSSKEALKDLPEPSYLDDLKFLYQSAELVAATSKSAHTSAVAEETIGRSFQGNPSWVPARFSLVSVAQQSSISDQVSLQILPDQLGNEVVAEILSYRLLGHGWDGENSARPSEQAITEAIRFVRLSAENFSNFDPTLHVDGSVILEISDGLGSLRFKGDGQVIYALSGTGYGVASLDGYTIPEAIRCALPL